MYAHLNQQRPLQLTQQKVSVVELHNYSNHWLRVSRALKQHRPRQKHSLTCSMPAQCVCVCVLEPRSLIGGGRAGRERTHPGRLFPACLPIFGPFYLKQVDKKNDTDNNEFGSTTKAIRFIGLSRLLAASTNHSVHAIKSFRPDLRLLLLLLLFW